MESIQPIDTNRLLDEAIAEAQRWEGTLGQETTGKAEAAFLALKEGKIELGNPEAAIWPLRMEDFEQQGIELMPAIKQSMEAEQGYHFYLVPLPVLLFPARGAQYRLVEARIELTVAEGQRPLAIQRIFPEPVWKPVLTWGSSFNLALDNALQWGTELEQTEAEIGTLSGELAGRVKATGQLGGFIQVGTFQYTLGRMEIESQFAPDVAMWRLDSADAIRSQQQMRFITLLKVPKEVVQVQLSAAVQAEVAFNWLIAQIQHVFERLPEAIQQIVRQQKGLPLQCFETWTLSLHR
jgi:hypothetical protein